MAQSPSPAPAPAPALTASFAVENLPGRSASPQISFGRQGNAIALWSKRTTNSGPHTIRVRRHDAVEGWGDSIEPTDGGAQPAGLVTNANGQTTGSWTASSTGVGSYNRIYVSKFTPPNGWVPAAPLPTRDNGQIAGARIAMDAQGRDIAAWAETPQGKGESNGSRRYTADIGWGTAGCMRAGENPEVVIDRAGNTLAAWSNGHAGLARSAISHSKATGLSQP